MKRHTHYLPTRPSPFALSLIFCSLLITFSAHARQQTRHTAQLPAVDVHATHSGFGDNTATLGALGNKELLDTPYSVYVVSPEMIKNQQATSLPELMKYLPSTQMEARGGMDAGRPQSRGMRGDVVANIHLDGLNIVSTTAQPVEMMERLEVINSLTGALYGPANPAGNFNFTQKRPTREKLANLSLGYRSKEALNAHLDLGGHVGQNNQFGYRINLLQEEGKGFVTGSDTRRKLVAAAFDVHLFTDTVLELNASHYAFDKYGFPGGFAYNINQNLPKAPDASRPGYGQPFAGMELETTTWSTRLKHAFSPDWHFNASAGRQIADRFFTNPTNRLVGNNGNYNTSISAGTVAGRFEVDSNQAGLNGHFHTGTIRHELVLSTTGYDWKIYSATAGSTTYNLGNASVNNPRVYARQAFARGGTRYKSGNTRVQSYTAGDTMTFNPQWSLMLLANHAHFKSSNYNLAGTRTSHYDKNGLSGTAALTYKPLPELATYVAYADSLQQGGIAGNTTANAGQVLAPYRSEQYELGAKYTVGSMHVGLALFLLERPFAFTGTDNVFRVQGEQRNKGLELIFSGALSTRWSFYGGATFLDAKLGNTADSTTSGKRMVGVPRLQASLLSEYRVLEIPGLTLNANIRHTGKREINTQNTARVDGFNIFDLGVRYHQRYKGMDTTWRLTVNNVTDKAHWAAIFPGNIDGGVAAGSAFIGDPREIRASVTFAF